MVARSTIHYINKKFDNILENRIKWLETPNTGSEKQESVYFIWGNRWFKKKIKFMHLKKNMMKKWLISPTKHRGAAACPHVLPSDWFFRAFWHHADLWLAASSVWTSFVHQCRLNMKELKSRTSLHLAKYQPSASVILPLLDGPRLGKICLKRFAAGLKQTDPWQCAQTPTSSGHGLWSEIKQRQCCF